MRILVVKDEPAIAQFVCQGLTEANYAVDVVNDGRDALDYALATEYDAIILNRILIIMLTAIHSTTALRFAPDPDYLPVNSFVEKPIGPNELAEQVHKGTLSILLYLSLTQGCNPPPLDGVRLNALSGRARFPKSSRFVESRAAARASTA